MHPRPFCILNVLGDLLDDGEVRLVGTAKTLEAARLRIRTLRESRPGDFVIYNQQTGERVSVSGRAGGAVAPLLPQFGRGFWKHYKAKIQNDV